MKMHRAITVLLGLALLAATSTAFGATSTTVMGKRANVRVFLTSAGRPLVEEERKAAVRSGVNVISASFGSDKIDRGTLMLTPGDPADDLEIGGAIFPRATGKLVQWEVTSPRDQLVTLKTLYQIDGLTCTPEYELVFPSAAPESGTGLPLPVDDTGALRAEFVASVLVANGTGRDLPEAEFLLGDLSLGVRPLASGEAVKLVSQKVPDMLLQTSLVFDATRYGEAVALHAKLVNSAGSGLGQGALPAGKLRAYRAAPDGSPTLVGETTLERLPVDEDCEVFLGYQQDIRANRDQRPTTQTNVRRDQRGRPVAFDLDGMVRTEFENSRNEPVTVRVVEHVEGEWQVVKSTHRYEKVDATTMEFSVPVEPIEKTAKPTALEFTVRRRNIAP